MITIVTPTCDRPEAFALAEKYVARQTYRDFDWIVLDDGRVPVQTTLGQRVIRTPDTRGFSSLCRKMVGLFEKPDQIKGDGVLVMEDDDWYHPDYVARLAPLLERADLIGEGRTIYYNVVVRTWAVHTNMQHCSLCGTGFSRKAFGAFYNQAMMLDPYVDMRFWRNASSELKREIRDPEITGRHLVGIKGMPGLRGYSPQHDPNYALHRTAFQDADLTKLRALIGDDVKNYESYRS